MDKADLLIAIVLACVILHGIKTVSTRELTYRFGRYGDSDSETETFTGGTAVALGILEIVGAALGLIFYALPNLLR